MNIELGTTYQDSITGFVGVATGHTRYLDSSDVVFLEPRVIWDGKNSEGKWVSVTRLAPAPAVLVAGVEATPPAAAG